MTPREKRKRQKRADVRKVHRYGFLPKGNRASTTAACGSYVNGGLSKSVSDAAFVWLPRDTQCLRCRSARHACVPSLLTHGQLHGDYRHLMAVELLVATMQRLWQARLEVGHRCYVRIGQQSLCACGLASIVDLNLIGVTAARIAGTIDAPNDFARAIVMHHNDRRVQP